MFVTQSESFCDILDELMGDRADGLEDQDDVSMSGAHICVCNAMRHLILVAAHS